MKTMRRMISVVIIVVMMIVLLPAFGMQEANAVSKPGKAAITSLSSSNATSLKAKWKKVNGAKGYQLRYSLKSNMKGSKTLDVTTKSTTVKKLKAGKKYYVQVRAYKKSGSKRIYGKWSAKKSVMTQYSIKYVLNGGKQASGQKTAYAKTTSTFKLKNPTRAGYEFVGWYTTNKYTKKVTSVKKGSTGNKTFYAKWKKKNNTTNNGNKDSGNNGAGSDNEIVYTEDVNVPLCNDANVSVRMTGIKNGQIVLEVENKSTQEFNFGLAYLSFNGNDFYDDVMVSSLYAGKKRSIEIDDWNIGKYCFTGGPIHGQFYYYNNDTETVALPFQANVATSLPDNNTKPAQITKTLIVEDAKIALYKIEFNSDKFSFYIENKTDVKYNMGFNYLEFGGNTYYDEVFVTTVYGKTGKQYNVDKLNIGEFTYSGGDVSGQAYYYGDGDSVKLDF